MASVAVLLATYNGERYVGELLESLFAQSCTDWHLIVSDDGSQDGTPDILQRFLARYPDRMTLLPPHAATGSSKENFLYLTDSAAGYDYYMYCDQDDVWLPEKIGLTLDKMKETEAGQADVPCLVHTDLEVTDAGMRSQHQSFFYSSFLDPARDQLRYLLVQNIVTGCTVMFNRALRDLCCMQTDHDRIVIHDWWIALVCAACGGRISFLPRATILYRQHGGNVVGAKDVRSLRYMMGYLGRIRKNRSSLRASQAQAMNLLETLDSRLGDRERLLLAEYGRLGEKGKIGRIRVIIRNGIWLKGFKRKAGELLLI